MKFSLAIVFLFFTILVNCQDNQEDLDGLNEASEFAEDLEGRNDVSLEGEVSMESPDSEVELEDGLIGRTNPKFATSAKPKTVKPTTAIPTTPIPTTVKPTTLNPTTVKPTTLKPKEPCCGNEVKTYSAGISVSIPKHKPLKIQNKVDIEASHNKIDVEARKHILAVILKSPKLPALPKVDYSKFIAAGKKISEKVVAKKTVAKASVSIAAGKVLSTLVAAPKVIGKFILKKPLLHLAKKHALLGGALHLLGKKVMGIGAGVGLVGAKTAAAGVGLKGLSAASLSYVPGVKTLGLKAAKYIPGLGFVNAIATKGLSGALSSGMSSVAGLGHYSNLLLNYVLSDPANGQVYLVDSPYLDIVQSSH